VKKVVQAEGVMIAFANGAKRLWKVRAGNEAMELVTVKAVDYIYLRQGLAVQPKLPWTHYVPKLALNLWCSFISLLSLVSVEITGVHHYVNAISYLDDSSSIGMVRIRAWLDAVKRMGPLVKKVD
jgi:hypothetical protein